MTKRRSPTKRTRPKPRAAGKPRPRPAGPERLQKVLAAAGVASRRACEELIQEGRVEVDGQIVTELGVKVDPAKQRILVDGEPLRPAQVRCYMLNKPPGVVSTSRDPAGRVTVTEMVPPDLGRLFSVGRLDRSSEGLILLTNDGELANRLAHPRYGVPKTYLARVAGRPDREVIAALRRGVRLAEGVAKAQQVRIKSGYKQSTLLEIVLTEGKNREIRRMLAGVGHKVLELRRVGLGTLRLGELPPGAYRPLTPKEIDSLRGAAARATSQGPGPAASARRPPTGRPRKPSPKRSGSRTQKMTVLTPDSVKTVEAAKPRSKAKKKFPKRKYKLDAPASK